MTSTATGTRGLTARDGGTVMLVSGVLASLVLSVASRAEAVAVPGTTWPVLVAMVGAVAISMASRRSLAQGWCDLRRLLTLIIAVAATYPGLWALAVLTTAHAPDSTAAWVTGVLAGVAHLPIIGAFSVLPLLSVRYLGPGTGRATLAAVIILGVAAALSFVLFFDDFEPLAASAPISSDLGERVGMTLNLLFLTTVLLGPAVALLATWRSAADVSAARRLAVVAGSSLAGTLLVMVCGAMGTAADFGGVVLLVGMYAALAVVVSGCVRSVATEPSGPVALTTTTEPPEWRVAVDSPSADPDSEPASSIHVAGTADRADDSAAGTGADSPTRRLSTLTRRETEVLHLLADGLSNAGIAARLVLSERTVDAHLRSVFVKLDLPQGPEHNRRVQAVNAFRSATPAPSASAARSRASA